MNGNSLKFFDVRYRVQVPGQPFSEHPYESYSVQIQGQPYSVCFIVVKNAFGGTRTHANNVDYDLNVAP